MVATFQAARFAFTNSHQLHPTVNGGAVLAVGGG
jgi:hypothetical protein